MNLSPDYDIDLEAMLARLGTTSGVGPPLLTAFWPMTGSAYSGGLMVVGRAVNGWIDHISAPELANATARAQLLSPRSEAPRFQGSATTLYKEWAGGSGSHWRAASSP